MAKYGYWGGFIVSALGCGSMFIPIPMAALQFALGAILLPWFGPLWLGPLCVGLVCSIGEAIGSLSMYAAGHSGATHLFDRATKGHSGRTQKFYLWLMRMMERRGPLVLFFLSATMNPFYFPAALTCGAVRFGVKKYFLVTLVGKFVKCTAIAYAGFFGFRSFLAWIGVPV